MPEDEQTGADDSVWITLMNSSENDELPLRETRQTQILTPGATLQDATEWLHSCGVIADAVQAGEVVPDFELVNATGVNVNLGFLLDRGPVVITFILGCRSPRCRASLRALQKALPEIEAHHGTLVAISPDAPNASSAVAEEDNLWFDLLTDYRHQFGHLFGLTYQPPEPVAVWFDLLGLGAPRDGMSSDLILPATYVVDSNGIAVYAFLEPDPTQRVDPRAVIEALSRIPFEISARLG
jgi:peroxiredoxin